MPPRCVTGRSARPHTTCRRNTGRALLVIVGLFVAPWKAVVLLIYIVVYQQSEGGILPADGLYTPSSSMRW